jgi:HSP20 family protein
MLREEDEIMLTRWDPFADIARLQDQMARRWAGTETPEFQPGFAPAVDVFEEDTAFLVKAELPGMKPEEVHVSVENDVLTIKGERKLESAEKLKGYHRIERSYGMFTRSFTLPKTLDGEHLEAEMQDGVLKVRIPKRAAPEPKRVAIRGGSAPVKTGQPS